MTEYPIKLFSKRSERYPEPDETDTIQGGALAALSAIPVIGGTVTEILSMILAPAVSRRRDEWLKELADGLDQLEEKVDGFEVEKLAGNEGFVSAVIQATRTAATTHQREKLEIIRNAVLNVSLSRGTDEEKQIFFLHLIDMFSLTHFEILRLFANPESFPSTRRNDLRQRRALTDPMVLDLNDRGLLNDPRPYVARTRESPDSLTQQGWTLTKLGNELLSFIAIPDPLK